MSFTPHERPLRVALLDEDDAMRHVARKATEAQGWLLDVYPAAYWELCVPHAPDVLLMDTSMSSLHGIECIRKLKAMLPDLRIMILNTHCDINQIRLSWLAGACGYLAKPVSAMDLVHAVASAAQGWPAFCSGAINVMLAGVPGLGAIAPLGKLTRRELEVVSWLGQSLTNKEIGHRLGIATRTVHVHLVRAFRKMGVGSRQEALAKFLQLR